MCGESLNRSHASRQGTGSGNRRRNSGEKFDSDNQKKQPFGAEITSTIGLTTVEKIILEKTTLEDTSYDENVISTSVTSFLSRDTVITSDFENMKTMVVKKTEVAKEENQMSSTNTFSSSQSQIAATSSSTSVSFDHPHVPTSIPTTDSPPTSHLATTSYSSSSSSNEVVQQSPSPSPPIPYSQSSLYEVEFSHSGPLGLFIRCISIMCPDTDENIDPDYEVNPQAELSLKYYCR